MICSIGVPISVFCWNGSVWPVSVLNGDSLPRSHVGFWNSWCLSGWQRAIAWILTLPCTSPPQAQKQAPSRVSGGGASFRPVLSNWSLTLQRVYYLLCIFVIPRCKLPSAQPSWRRRQRLWMINSSQLYRTPFLTPPSRTSHPPHSRQGSHRRLLGLAWGTHGA
jgi:hypothetical protein